MLDQVAKRRQTTAKQKLRDVAYAPTFQKAERRRRPFQSWARGEGWSEHAELIEDGLGADGELLPDS